MTYIKICGITNIKDARIAIDMGADALGFIFAESPRKISPKTAQTIISQLPLDRLYIGVFVNHTPTDIIKIKNECGLDTVQIHDDIADIDQIYKDIRIIKGVRVKPDKPIPQFNHPNIIMLLDTYAKSSHGGTGKTFDWQKAIAIAKQKPIILAGGLTPDNVSLAIETVRPFAVDVSSGVEQSKGLKDHKKVCAFIENVRATDQKMPSLQKHQNFKDYFMHYHKQ
jgi:phosphoribosylanthranilate isomerase